MKWMAIDYGDVRIGVAVSDPLEVTARGVKTIKWNGQDMATAVERIYDLMLLEKVEGLVVGVPRRTDGKPGPSEDKARSLAQLLHERSGIEPVLQDERYTTVLAGRIMREAGIRGPRQRQIVDQIAAEIILRDHLERRRKETR
jgi:putative Holliday junction resolvase